MKVLMINGSRREAGCTYTALNIVADSLKEEGIDSEIVFVGKDALNGSIDQLVKALREKCAEADGFVFGSPVYYASATGEVQVVLDRLFGAASAELNHKPAAVVASARRAGTTATLDILAKYPSINEMPIVTSCYWTMVHGNKPEEVMQDQEGVYTLKQLGKNLAWIMKSIEAGRKAGVTQPEKGQKPQTNFIR
ncbi:MAG TPA: flavodoxin family protein [Lachnospiraceae bacterium]|nr:flavodoxin family protein [Lachnospiraceae bacterium]